MNDMNDLVSAKLEFCTYMTMLIEGLGTETAQELFIWLKKVDFTRAHFFEFWSELEEVIETTEM